MKKSLVALAALTAVSGLAQADVTLYGILDVGVASETHSGDFSPTFVTGVVPTGSPAQHLGTSVGMMNGGEKQTRWGVKGWEDLGNGNKAFFQMESAFSLGTGALGTSALAGSCQPKTAGSNLCGTPSTNMIADTSLNNQLFGRNAFVGLSNTEYGALTFGRQNSLDLDVITSTAGGYDPVNAQMFSPINFSGFYGGGGATDSARVDNAVKYSNKFYGVDLNAMYGLGGMAGNNSARSTGQMGLGLERDRFGVEVVGQYARDTTQIGAAPQANTVNATFMDLHSFTGALRYSVTDALTAKVGGQYIRWSTPSNYSTLSGMTQIYTYTLNPVGNGSALFSGAKEYNVYWLGANYQFTPKLKVSVGYYDVLIKAGTYGSSATSLTPAGSAAVGSGADRYSSVLVDYDLSKRTNLYAGYMHDEKGGSANVGSYGPNQTYDTVGAGIVHRF